MTTFDERAREWDTPERIARAARVAAAIRGSPLVPTTGSSTSARGPGCSASPWSRGRRVVLPIRRPG